MNIGAELGQYTVHVFCKHTIKNSEDSMGGLTPCLTHLWVTPVTWPFSGEEKKLLKFLKCK